MQTTEPISTDSPERPAPTASNGSGDARLDTILAKKARGETIDNKERGYLSYKNSQSNGTFKPGAGQPGKSGRPPKPAQPSTPVGNTILPSAVPTPAPVVGIQRPPPDPGLVKNTVKTVIDTIENYETRWVQNESSARGAKADLQDNLMSAVRLLPANRSMIIDSSPEALAAMGIDVTKFPVWMFLGGLLAWQASFFSAVMQIRNMDKPKPAPKPAPASPEPGASHPPVEAKGTVLPPRPPTPKYDFQAPGKEPVTGEV